MTGAGMLDPDAATGYLRDWQSRIERTAAGTRALSEQLDRLRVTAADPHDLAEVTVDATGRLVDLRLTERIQRFAPDAVSRAVLAALREAQQTAAGRSRELATEALGPDSVAARTIADRVGPPLRAPGSPGE